MRILPLLLIIALLSFGLRVGEVFVGLRDLSGGAVAAEEKKADAEQAPDKNKENTPEKTTGNEDNTKKSETDTQKADGKDTTDANKTAWPDALEMDSELSDVKNKLLKDLAARREQLDTREKELGLREALLKAAEAEMDQKYTEMVDVREQLKVLLGQQSEAEAARVKSLVSIYESMKPADAARIFNTLDVHILLDVMTRMSEKKTAPILAAMDEDRARTVTLMMAQQRKLPDLPELSP